MYLEIQDAQIKGNKVVFKLEYDEEFRLEIGKIKKLQNPTKKDIQEYIFSVIEHTIDFDALTQEGD